MKITLCTACSGNIMDPQCAVCKGQGCTGLVTESTPTSSPEMGLPDDFFESVEGVMGKIEKAGSEWYQPPSNPTLTENQLMKALEEIKAKQPWATYLGLAPSNPKPTYWVRFSIRLNGMLLFEEKKPILDAWVNTFHSTLTFPSGVEVKAGDQLQTTYEVLGPPLSLKNASEMPW